MQKELARLRRENELLRAERDLLKKATAFQGNKPLLSRLAAEATSRVSFALIDAEKAAVPVETACSVLDVSVSGYYTWQRRPASRRQSDDLIVMAHIRAEFSNSHETYGSPRMYVELKERGLAIGRHRIARLMSANGLKARQKTRFKRTTDSDHAGPFAANMIEQGAGCPHIYAIGRTVPPSK